MRTQPLTTRVRRCRDWLTNRSGPEAHTASSHIAAPTTASRDRGGASLVEVMVAMVISAVLLASIIGLLDSSSSAARSMESRAEINERSSQLHNRLGAVLRSAVELEVATATQVCTSARSRTPVANLSTASATPFEGAPREACVLVEGSLIQSVTTTSGSPSTELIFTGATGSAFTYFDADATLVTPDALTSQISESDLARVRRVVFTTTISDRLGRTTETIQIEFALGASRFGAEQSWRGRVGATTSATTSGGEP